MQSKLKVTFREVNLNIKRLMEIGSYRGIRQTVGLPVREDKILKTTHTRKGKAMLRMLVRKNNIGGKSLG